MNVFSTNQKKRVAGNIRKGMEAKFSAYGRNQRLASLLGVSPATVSRWANGKSVPSLSHLYAMSRLFGIPLHRLCGYSGKRPVRTESPAFNNIMTLSIVLEQAMSTANGMDKATRATLEKMGETLAGVLETR